MRNFFQSVAYDQIHSKILQPSFSSRSRLSSFEFLYKPHLFLLEIAFSSREDHTFYCTCCALPFLEHNTIQTTTNIFIKQSDTTLLKHNVSTKHSSKCRLSSHRCGSSRASAHCPCHSHSHGHSICPSSSDQQHVPAPLGVFDQLRADRQAPMPIPLRRRPDLRGAHHQTRRHHQERRGPI